MRFFSSQVGGVDPTVHTYKAVMRACASAEQSRHVMQLLRRSRAVHVASEDDLVDRARLRGGRVLHRGGRVTRACHPP